MIASYETISRMSIGDIILKKNQLLSCVIFLANDHGEMQKHCKVICRECLPSPHIHICPSAFGSVLPK